MNSLDGHQFVAENPQLQIANFVAERVMSEWDRILGDLANVEHDVDRAVAACDSLDRAADESWLPKLHQLLAEGENFFLREAAAAPIARLEGLKALPQLLHALQLGEDEGHDNDGLGSMIMDLVSINPSESAPILLQMIRDTSERRRSHAAWLCGHAAEAISPNSLLELLNDPSPTVRASVAGALSSFKGQESVVEGLFRLLKDIDEQVRVSAASSLGYLGDKNAKAALFAALIDSSERVRTTAKYSLGQLKKL